MNEEIAARICVLGNEIKDASEREMDVANAKELAELCDNLTDLIEQAAE
ncbi:hypothetical protein [Ruegeria atlantica]|nr:hypothetical protein [Ruegeria atlantica]